MFTRFAALQSQVIAVAPLDYTNAMDAAYALALTDTPRAIQRARGAVVAAVSYRRPDLAYRANDLLSTLGAL